MKKQIIIIGLGRFGASLATTLSGIGHDVLALDRDEKKVQDIALQITHTVQADATNETILNELGIGNFDVAIVAMGSAIESSVLSTILLKKLGVDLAQQKAHLESLKPLLTQGHIEEGRKIFFGKKAACSGCHAVEDQGGKVGPDLTRIGAIRTGTDLLEAIALPSASFARGYRSYLVVTDSGRIYTGVISRESTDTVYLRTADLSEVRIARDEIEVMKESPTSIMPKGLEQRLTPQEIRDLLAYLQNRK